MGPNNSIRVVTTLYQIILATTKAAKNMVAILLGKIVSAFPIRNPLYHRWGGRTLRWNKLDNIPKIPIAIW